MFSPVFEDDNINADNYLKILKEHVAPYVDEQFEELVLQQDGAPAHYANKVRNFLNEKFPGTWIGRRGSIEWPARSPDLTPMDFFFWGVLRDRVYTHKIKDRDHLREVITREASIIASDRD